MGFVMLIYNTYSIIYSGLKANDMILGNKLFNNIKNGCTITIL